MAKTIATSEVGVNDRRDSRGEGPRRNMIKKIESPKHEIGLPRGEEKPPTKRKQTQSMDATGSLEMRDKKRGRGITEKKGLHKALDETGVGETGKEWSEKCRKCLGGKGGK